jgi:hypothetical protein
VEIDDILRSDWPPSDGTVRALLQTACVDAYDEYEQATSIHCVIEDWGSLPCLAVVAGATGTLVEVDLRQVLLVGLVRFGDIGPIPLASSCVQRISCVQETYGDQWTQQL